MSNPNPATTPREYKDNPFEKQFTPKVPVTLEEPREDEMTYEELSKHDGTDPEKPILVAIKGTIFDVTRNKAYKPGGNYHVFAGKDPSRALGMSSLDAKDCVPDWHDLEEQHKTVLSEWYMFFSKRYNIIGKVVGSSKTESEVEASADGVVS